MYTKDIITYYGTIRKSAEAIRITYQRFHQIQKEELAPENVAALLHCITGGQQRNGLRLKYKKELYGRE